MAMTCGPGPTYMVRRWSRTKPSSSSSGNSSDIRSTSSHWSALSGAKQWTIGNSALSWGKMTTASQCRRVIPARSSNRPDPALIVTELSAPKHASPPIDAFSLRLV
jgi:hypothetical protein